MWLFSLKKQKASSPITAMRHMVSKNIYLVEHGNQVEMKSFFLQAVPKKQHFRDKRIKTGDHREIQSHQFYGHLRLLSHVQPLLPT